MTNNALIHIADEIARLVRPVARAQIATPATGSSILVRPFVHDRGEGIETMLASVASFRRYPSDEIVRVDLRSYDAIASPADLRRTIIKEVLPFIIGVGEVRGEESPEGFKIFLADDCKDCNSHLRL